MAAKENERIWDGYAKTFIDALVKVLADRVDRLSEENAAAFNMNIINHVLDEPEQKIEHEYLAGEEEMLTVLQSFIAVQKVYQRIEYDAQVFRNRMPDADKISNSDYMKRLITDHMNAIYILEERIKKFGQTVKNVPGVSKKAVSKAIAAIIGITDKAFKFELKARGHHTHITEYDDDKLDKLSSLELYIRGNILGGKATPFLRIFTAAK